MPPLDAIQEIARAVTLPALTAKLTAKPMDAAGLGGRSWIRDRPISEGLQRRGRRRTLNLRIRNHQVAGSIPAGGWR